jgi:hypothetical protein
MGLDDFVESEVGIAIAATAVALSPQVRGVVRKGLVYGVAGALMAGDMLGALARGVGRGASGATAAAAAMTARAGQETATTASVAAEHLADLAADTASPAPDEGAAEPRAGEKHSRRSRGTATAESREAAPE